MRNGRVAAWPVGRGMAGLQSVRVGMWCCEHDGRSGRARQANRDAAGPAAPSAAGASAHRRMTTPTMDSGGTHGPVRSSAAHADPPPACRPPRPRPPRDRLCRHGRAIRQRRAERPARHASRRRPAPIRRRASTRTSRWAPTSRPAAATSATGPLTVPKPGQLDPRPVKIEELTADVIGRHVLVIATWTSGVEPCYVLDRIVVEKGAGFVHDHPVRGPRTRRPICIEIAKTKQAAGRPGRCWSPARTRSPTARAARPRSR